MLCVWQHIVEKQMQPAWCMNRCGCAIGHYGVYGQELLFLQCSLGQDAFHVWRFVRAFCSHCDEVDSLYQACAHCDRPARFPCGSHKGYCRMLEMPLRCCLAM